jgi:glycosyltransferase involved in cell wall biosynthesis
MLWESSDYFEGEKYGFLKPIKFLSKPFLSFPLSRLREWDYISAQRVDHFIANSRTPVERIKKYYGRSSEIIYPFVEYEKFAGTDPVQGDYFVVLTRLVSWKRADIAIEACNKLGLKLKIIGEGPDMERLKSISGSTVEFLDYVSDRKKVNVLSNARALINTQKEDFGIVPLEAMASGKPVIAFGEGGVLETVIPGVTGEFFYEQTPESLIALLRIFHPEKYDPYKCRKRAQKFDKGVFCRDMKAFVQETSRTPRV